MSFKYTPVLNKTRGKGQISQRVQTLALASWVIYAKLMNPFVLQDFPPKRMGMISVRTLEQHCEN